MNLAVLENVKLLKGSHQSREQGVCVMEAVAWVAGRPHSDTPECVCPVIGAFLRSWNDGIEDDGERTELLVPLVPLVIGTKSTKVIEGKRAMMCVDWLIRDALSTWLDLCDGEKYRIETEALRRLPAIDDWQSVIDATPILVELQKKAAAARDDAWDDAWAAVRAAVWDDAWAAVRAAARAAAWAAALAAAWDDAWAAVRAAAWDDARAAALAAAWDDAKKKLGPVKKQLQTSAVDLVRRMVLVRD